MGERARRAPPLVVRETSDSKEQARGSSSEQNNSLRWGVVAAQEAAIVEAGQQALAAWHDEPRWKRPVDSAAKLVSRLGRRGTCHHGGPGHTRVRWPEARGGGLRQRRRRELLNNRGCSSFEAVELVLGSRTVSRRGAGGLRGRGDSWGQRVNTVLVARRKQR